MRTAIVVGGGIGGLAAAVGLHRAGWRVRVLERAPRFSEIGAGLSLWPNAQRAFDVIGLGEQVRAIGGIDVGTGGVRDSAGRWLARADTRAWAPVHGSVIMVHRADLLAVLLDAVPAGALQAGVTVTGARTATDTAIVTHTGGEERADLVVGADGINSAVRESGWPDAPGARYAGYTAWRLITPPLPKLDEGGESWGRGERFGLAQLPDGRVYCYATATMPQGRRARDGELVEVRRRFAGWHDPIPAILAATEPGAVLRHDVYDLPPLKAFTRGRVALVGDAAHAMTPNLGQGACQAIEDAATLAVLAEGNDVPAALAEFDRLRPARTRPIVLRSRRVGDIGQWAWPPAAVLRNVAMRLAPESAFVNTVTWMLDWQPPAPITAGHH